MASGSDKAITTPSPLLRFFTIGLDPSARLESDAAGLRVTRGSSGLEIGSAGPGLAEILDRMCAAPLPPQVLVKARATLPVIERLGFDLILERLFAARCLTLGVSDGDRKILQVRNVAAAGRKARPLLGAELGRYVLSRFCHAHRNSGRLCLLVPLHGYEATVEDDAMAVAVARLCSPVTLDDVGDGVAMRDALRLLVAIGALEQEGAEDPRLEIWEEHDLLFHLRARAGFHDHPSGATFRFGETRRMPPLRPEASRQAVPLCRPQGTPPPGSLFDVLERRRSTRDPAARALTVEQLSSLLYHSARITHVQETPAGVVATRPFPSGGALQELGLYLTVNRCQGLDRGCYRYDDLNHALDPVAADMGMLEHLLDGSAFSTMLGRRPDVLVIMAGRIERLEVKYEGIVYSLMLKHVGCVIQTFYLVATELDIGCCAVGDSNSALFARATGIDALIEPVLGELMLNGGPS